jgi:hypothetical protein
MKTGRRHSPESRRRIAEGTRAAMAAPALRRRISEATKRGMGTLPELNRLRAAWRDARPLVRRRFLNELWAPLVDAEGSRA